MKNKNLDTDILASLRQKEVIRKLTRRACFILLILGLLLRGLYMYIRYTGDYEQVEARVEIEEGQAFYKADNLDKMKTKKQYKDADIGKEIKIMYNRKNPAEYFRVSHIHIVNIFNILLLLVGLISGVLNVKVTKEISDEFSKMEKIVKKMNDKKNKTQ